MTITRRLGATLLTELLATTALTSCGGDDDDRAGKDADKTAGTATSDEPSIDPAIAALQQAPADLKIAPYSAEVDGASTTLGGQRVSVYESVDAVEPFVVSVSTIAKISLGATVTMAHGKQTLDGQLP